MFTEGLVGAECSASWETEVNRVIIDRASHCEAMDREGRQRADGRLLGGIGPEKVASRKGRKAWTGLQVAADMKPCVICNLRPGCKWAYGLCVPGKRKW